MKKIKFKNFFKKKILLASLLLIILFASVIIYTCNKIIQNTANGKLYSDIKNIPYNKVGILLGTSKYLASGYQNPYYAYRIQASIQLLKAGKIKYIVVSGDNSVTDYNEPELMRTDLMQAGIDSSYIYLDYAGFRTLDSMVRLKKIFGQDSVTIISQAFHNERALYIASKENITAIAFNAKDVSKAVGFRVQMREKLARVKVFVDYLVGKEPKFLGEKINIP